mgnify:CR=1 FL=1
MGNVFSDNNINLVEENKILREKISKLEDEVNQLKNKSYQNNDDIKLFYKNLEKSVDNYVDEMLKDEEINSIIPDYIEKRIYKNVFQLVFKLMKNITDSTKISFMNQEIKLNMSSKVNYDTEYEADSESE